MLNLIDQVARDKQHQMNKMANDTLDLSSSNSGPRRQPLESSNNFSSLSRITHDYFGFPIDNIA